MLKHFKWAPFLAGLVLGGLVLMFYKTAPPVVYDYPHPKNVKDRFYKDKNGVCYQYDAKEVDCNSNEATLKPYPLQG
jgi:hypothetical protein